MINTNVLGVIITMVILVILMVYDNPTTVNETTGNEITVATIKDITDLKKQEIYMTAIDAIDNLNSLRRLEKYTIIELEATCQKYLNTYQCNKSAMIYALLKDAKLTAARN